VRCRGHMRSAYFGVGNGFSQGADSCASIGSTTCNGGNGGIFGNGSDGCGVPVTFDNRTTADGLGVNSVLGTFAGGPTVYAATNLGVAISSNGGASFTNRTTADGLGSNNVSSVQALGSTVYGGSDNGLSISTNVGTSFTNYTIAEGLGSNTVKGVYAVGTAGLERRPTPPPATASPYPPTVEQVSRTTPPPTGWPTTRCGAFSSLGRGSTPAPSAAG